MSQYRLRPAGAHRNMPASMSGMSIMIRCCAGSRVLGVIFCITNIEAPMSTGVRKSGSFWARSGIQRKGAPRSSIETVRTR